MSSDRYPRDVVGDGRLQVIAALPTGSGKTRIAIRVIQGMLPRLPEGSTVVFLAPTVPLCAQVSEQVIAALPTGSGKTRIAIRVIQGMLPRLPEGCTVVFLAPTVPLCAQVSEQLLLDLDLDLQLAKC
ncbi:dicer-like protein 2 [Haematococcus lacustris]|uniref:Dicer-like protein 2 n=1 Tax=Haematococcus lacustris TaxID=44745 RepID=A0A6A0A2H2_HAELA|nr:dicer-like protein 2 [Haematococcus lacustris]